MKHKLLPCQEALVKKLEDPLNDREVIFVIDPIGDCGKTWFTSFHEEEHGKSIQVGVDKREIHHVKSSTLSLRTEPQM